MSTSFYEKLKITEEQTKMDPLERVLRKDPGERTPTDLSIVEGVVEVSICFQKSKVFATNQKLTLVLCI